MRPASTFEPVALTLDDILFQTRNRAYGAFDLRQHYQPTLFRALWLGVGLFLLGLGAPALYRKVWPDATITNTLVMTEVTLQKIDEPPAEIPVPVPPAEPLPTVSTVRNLPPVVMPEADVVEDNLPPTTEQLKDATSGTETLDGTGDIAIIAPPEVNQPTVREKAVDLAPKTEQVFITVEQEPQYPGGMDALRTFLSKHLVTTQVES